MLTLAPEKLAILLGLGRRAFTGTEVAVVAALLLGGLAVGSLVIRLGRGAVQEEVANIQLRMLSNTGRVFLRSSNTLSK